MHDVQTPVPSQEAQFGGHGLQLVTFVTGFQNIPYPT